MPFNERDIGDGIFAAARNNEKNSERGTFVREGGAVTPGTSSSEVKYEIGATEIRVDGTDYSAASGQVTVTSNTASEPRRDLVIARAGDTTSDPATYDVLVGETITPAMMDRLQKEDQPFGAKLDDDGEPLHEVDNIPQVQPPAAQNLRQEAAVLAMVFVPPGTVDSSDISNDYITDLRMQGIGVEDVLRSGDAVEDLEAYDTAANGAVQTTVENTERHAQRAYTDAQIESTPHLITETLDPGEDYHEALVVPNGRRLRTWALGVSADGQTGLPIQATVRASGATTGAAESTTSEGFISGAPLTNSPSDGVVRELAILNNDDVARKITGLFVFTLEPTGEDYGYDGGGG